MEFKLNLNKYGGNTNIIISIIFNKIRDFLILKNKEKLFLYIKSVKLVNANIYIKTNKPIINAELKIFETELQNIINDILTNFGFKYKEIKIIFK